MRKPSLPKGIKAETIEQLPHTPGVYIFYGDQGVPLYVGKSKDIKDRVLSHFASDYSSNKEMQLSQQVTYIETIQTCGELGALVKESQLVKQLQPLYNRKLRNSRKLIKLCYAENTDGYNIVAMETVQSINPQEVPSIIGIFKSQRQAKQFLIDRAKESGLCEKLLGLEKTRGACFAYRLGSCKGACVREEKSMTYNFRFVSAFSKYKFKSWPFPGPIELIEKDDDGKSESFILENWCLVGQKKTTLETQESLHLKPTFDLDTYKILLSFLNKKTHSQLLLKQHTSQILE
jgi:DNA polymerase-3 subunit epsilon